MVDAGKVQGTVRPVYPEDWALRLEADFDEYMDRLYESVDGDIAEDGAGAGVDAGDAVDASGTYFCGCEVCQRRASWTWLMIRIVEAYRDGLITLEPVEDLP